MRIAVLLLVATLMSCTRASKPEVSSLKFDFSKISEKGSSLIPQSAIPQGTTVCFGVNVLASDIALKPAHKCTPKLGIFAGFVPEASELSVEVPFGKDREVQLYAFLPKDNSTCVMTNGGENGSGIDPQSVFLIGKMSNQTFDKPEVTLQMPVVFPGTEHSIFADLGMDSSCMNTSTPVVDPNAPVVLKSSLSPTLVSSFNADEFISLSILVKSTSLPNQITLSHDGPNGNISNAPSTQMFYACTLASISMAGHICEGASVDNYYAIRTFVASQWAPNGQYKISFSVRNSTFFESQFFTGLSYNITNHLTYGPPTIENIVPTYDPGLTAGIGGNVSLTILVQSTAGPDVLDKTVIQPDGTAMSMGTTPASFTNCASYSSMPAHVCYLKTINHWYYNYSEYFNPFVQNGTYIYQNIRVRNLTNLFSSAYSPLNFSVSGNATPITPVISKISAFYAFGNDPFTSGIPYYNSSCVRPEGGTANLGVRLFASTNANINYISYKMQGPNSVLAAGGQVISGTYLGGNNWQADYSFSIFPLATAVRGIYSWNDLNVKNIANQDSNTVQGPFFKLSDSCLTTYTSVSSYAGYTCGISASNLLKCWGQNTYNMIDHGTTTPRNYPTVVDGNENYKHVATGVSHTCAINSVNKLKCWGYNTYGQIGDGTTSSTEIPKVIDPTTAYLKISAGTNHTCGITTAGVLKCWGQNGYGQLGDGSAVDKFTPTTIDSGTSYIEISTASAHTCGITTTGVLKCWGHNLSGQLGDGTFTGQSSPIVIDSGTNYYMVKASETGTCGITSGRALKCWGSNTDGKLGDGTTVYKTTPILINSGTSYADLSSGYFHTCAITLTGILNCWGSNSAGQIGDGTTTVRTAPVIIDSGVVYSKVTAGKYHTCAITDQGYMKCWGQNVINQLGNGNTSDSLLPIGIDL